MATAKTTALSFPIEPGRKKVMRMDVDREHRSIANVNVIATHRAHFLGVEENYEAGRLSV